MIYLIKVYGGSVLNLIEQQMEKAEHLTGICYGLTLVRDAYMALAYTYNRKQDVAEKRFAIVNAFDIAETQLEVALLKESTEDVPAPNKDDLDYQHWWPLNRSGHRERIDFIKKHFLNNGHTLYKTGDEGVPDAILDRNNEVVLSMCKVCGRVESELDQECIKGTMPITSEFSEFPPVQPPNIK